MKVLRNLPQEAMATQSHTGMQNSDNLRNSALRAIEIIRKYRGAPKKVDAYIKEAWDIY